jgi:hypothetical protein
LTLVNFTRDESKMDIVSKMAKSLMEAKRKDKLVKMNQPLDKEGKKWNQLGGIKSAVDNAYGVKVPTKDCKGLTREQQEELNQIIFEKDQLEKAVIEALEETDISNLTKEEFEELVQQTIVELAGKGLFKKRPDVGRKVAPLGPSKELVSFGAKEAHSKVVKYEDVELTQEEVEAMENEINELSDAVKKRYAFNAMKHAGSRAHMRGEKGKLTKRWETAHKVMSKMAHSSHGVSSQGGEKMSGYEARHMANRLKTLKSASNLRKEDSDLVDNIIGFLDDIGQDFQDFETLVSVGNLTQEDLDFVSNYIFEKNWIQGMHMKKGALTKKAEKAGESPMEFAHSHEHAKGKTGKEARLAVTFSHMRHKK